MSFHPIEASDADRRRAWTGEQCEQYAIVASQHGPERVSEQQPTPRNHPKGQDM
eukprot:m.478460 g.478460  ORF g.478460 m.478460 type:complete len:54 (+) comp46632_c0_seq1:47-208(+)